MFGISKAEGRGTGGGLTRHERQRKSYTSWTPEQGLDSPPPSNESNESNESNPVHGVAGVAGIHK